MQLIVIIIIVTLHNLKNIILLLHNFLNNLLLNLVSLSPVFNLYNK